MEVKTVERSSAKPAKMATETLPGEYVARVREIAPALAAAAPEIDRRRERPADIVDGLVERGLFRLL